MSRPSSALTLSRVLVHGSEPPKPKTPFPDVISIEGGFHIREHTSGLQAGQQAIDPQGEVVAMGYSGHHGVDVPWELFPGRQFDPVFLPCQVWVRQGVMHDDFAAKLPEFA